MNSLAGIALPDVQGGGEHRGVALDEVGISGLSYPLHIRDGEGSTQQTVAEAELVVALAASERGTHMSRFVEALHEHRGGLGPDGALTLARDLTERLETDAAFVRLTFPLFVERRAPISGAESLLRLDCGLSGRSGRDGEELHLSLRVAVTSLCPCSKEIADYGAHSQRGYVAVDITDRAWATGGHGLWFGDLLRIIDAASSAPIYPALKRADEREVTMAAYDNPAFVEDLARDVALELRGDERIDGFVVAVENQESIHDHQAIARVNWRRG